GLSRRCDAESANWDCDWLSIRSGVGILVRCSPSPIGFQIAPRRDFRAGLSSPSRLSRKPDQTKTNDAPSPRTYLQINSSSELRSAMDRKLFLKGLVVIGAAVPCGAFADAPKTGKCEDASCMSDAGAVRQFLSDFLAKEEKNLDRVTLVKLMQQRGRACCRNL